jgi:hypothetical protein
MANRLYSGSEKGTFYYSVIIFSPDMQFVLIMPCSRIFAVFRALKLLGITKVVGFGIKQLVQGPFHITADQLSKLVLDGGFIKFE